jgi:hypothetical protein
MEKGAQVNAQGGPHSNALKATSWRSTVQVGTAAGLAISANPGNVGRAVPWILPLCPTA